MGCGGATAWVPCRVILVPFRFPRSMLPCCPLLGPGVSLSARSTVGGWPLVHPLCFEPSRIRRAEKSEERASESFRLWEIHFFWLNESCGCVQQVWVPRRGVLLLSLDVSSRPGSAGGRDGEVVELLHHPPPKRKRIQECASMLSPSRARGVPFGWLFIG